MTIVKYLNPRNDIAFKKIFGTEKNKDILIHFLNDVIVTGGNGEIKKVTLLNPTQYPDIATSKQSVVDVLCEDEHGITYIVEMQVAKVAGFEKRAQYYAAKAYASQPEKGDKTYDHLKAVIFLAITEYEMFPKKKEYKSDHVILDKDSYDHDLKDFSFTFIELPKFKKEAHELKNYEEKWCYFFKHANNADNIEELIANSDEVIKKAYHQLRAHNWTKEELRAYEASEKSARDARAREKYVHGEGLAEGIAKGMAQGLEKGMAEGIAKGIAKGKIEGLVEGRIEIAKTMLLENEPIEKIHKFTGLSAADIKNIEGNIKSKELL